MAKLMRRSIAPTHTMSGLWPSADQKLLLKATLLSDSEALAAFEQWCILRGLSPSNDAGKAAVFNCIDHATVRLLPLLHHRLQTTSADNPITQELADVYLDSWMRLNSNLSFLLPVLRLMSTNKVETLMLKGAPLAYEYYPLPATRPMVDFDVLIKAADIKRAIDLLAEAGWHPMRKLISGDFRFRHAQSFINSQGVEFDLHWHVTPVACNPEADKEFWQRSMPFELAGVASRRLDPTDSLLHTLIHGVHVFAWNAEPAIRWIPDSILILKKDSLHIEWERICDFAKRYRLSHRMASALRYLQTEMGADINPSTVEKLQSTPLSMLERLEHRPRKMMHIAISTNAESSATTSLTDKLVQFLRYRHGSTAQGSRDMSGGKAGIIAFLVYKHRVNSIRDVLGTYAHKLASVLNLAPKNNG